jgi:hypothetical protein
MFAAFATWRFAQERARLAAAALLDARFGMFLRWRASLAPAMNISPP